MAGTDPERNHEPTEPDRDFLKEVGEELRAGREQQEASLGEISYKLKIRRDYLEALEEGDWQATPGAVYFLAYLRSCARLLELDADGLAAKCYQDQQFRSSLSGAKGALAFDSANQKGLSSQQKLVAASLVIILVAGVIIAFDRLQVGPLEPQTCKPLHLSASRQTEVSVRSMGLGNELFSGTMKPGDKLHFADTRGFRIDSEEPEALSIRYASRYLSRSELSLDQGNRLLLRCRELARRR